MAKEIGILDQYLKEHRRNICPGCQLWVPFYQDKKGEMVYGCQIGLIPRNDECGQFKSKRRQSA